MAGTRELKIALVGDASSFERSLKRASGGLSSFSKIALGVGAIVAGVGVEMKKAIEGAIEDEAGIAKLGAAYKGAGLNIDKYKSQIDGAIQTAQKMGFVDNDVRESLSKLIIATGDSAEAVKDLSIAQDIARFRGIDLADASKMLAMAMVGNLRAVKQLGLNILPVTSHMDALKRAHVDLTTEQGRALQATAKLADKQETGAKVLDIVKEKLGGQAKAYSQTAAGAMSQFAAVIDDIQDRIGAALLPALKEAAEFVIQHWPEIARVGEQVASAIGTAMQRLAGFIKTHWSTITNVIKTAFDIVKGVAQVALGLMQNEWGRAMLIAVGAAYGLVKAIQAIKVAFIATRAVMLTFGTAAAGPFGIVIGLAAVLAGVIGSKLVGSFSQGASAADKFAAALDRARNATDRIIGKARDAAQAHRDYQTSVLLSAQAHATARGLHAAYIAQLEKDGKVTPAVTEKKRQWRLAVLAAGDADARVTETRREANKADAESVKAIQSKVNNELEAIKVMEETARKTKSNVSGAKEQIAALKQAAAGHKLVGYEANVYNTTLARSQKVIQEAAAQGRDYAAAQQRVADESAKAVVQFEKLGMGAAAKAANSTREFALAAAEAARNLQRIPTEGEIAAQMLRDKLPAGAMAAAKGVALELGKIPNIGQENVTALVQMIQSRTGELVASGMTIGQALKQATKESLKSLGIDVTGQVKKAIDDAGKAGETAAGQHGKATGNRLVLATVEGIRAKKGDATAGMAQMQVLAGQVRAGGKEAEGGGKELTGAFAKGIKAAVEIGKEAARKVAGEAAKSFSGAKDTAHTQGSITGAAGAQGIYDGFMSLWPQLNSQLLTVQQTFWKDASQKQGKSPADVVTAELIGKPGARGIGDGFLLEWPRTEQRILATTQASWPKLGAAIGRAQQVAAETASKVGGGSEWWQKAGVAAMTGFAMGVGKYGAEARAAVAKVSQEYANDLKAKASTAFEKAAVAAQSAFDRKMAAWKNPTQALIDKFQIADQLKQLTADLADALIPDVTDAEGNLTKMIADPAAVAAKIAEIKAVVASGNVDAIQALRDQGEAVKGVVDFYLEQQATAQQTAHEKQEAKQRATLAAQLETLRKELKKHPEEYDKIMKEVDRILDKWNKPGGPMESQGTQGVNSLIAGMLKKHPDLLAEITGPGGINEILKGIGKEGGGSGSDLFNNLGATGVMNMIKGMIAQHPSLETEITGKDGINDILARIKTQIHVSVEITSPAEVARKVQEINRAIENPDQTNQGGPTQNASSGANEGGGSGIPSLAQGAIVRYKPGGTIVRVGERYGQDEAVIPLTGRARVSSFGGVPVINIHVGQGGTFVGNDHRKVAETLAGPISDVLERRMKRNRGVRR